VEEVFEECHSSQYQTVKEETFCGIRDWYKATHSVAPAASAADMAEIMEAYWNLSSKRFIDNCCMMTDADLLGDLPARIQDEMYNFLSDDRQLEVPYRHVVLFCLGHFPLELLQSVSCAVRFRYRFATTLI
jgi:hypothetical protein